MNSSEVQYFDSDFLFEEHARDCIALAQQQQRQKLDRSSSSCDCSVVISYHHPSSSSSSSKLSCCTRNSEDNVESFSPPGHEENTRDGFLRDYDDTTLHPQSQAKCWDAFHTNHSAGNFYKPRRYLVKSFPCIMQYLIDETPCRSGDNSNDDTRQQVDGQSSARDDKIILEIGCGSGSSCIPLIKQYYKIVSEKQKHLAGDNSRVIEEEEQRRILLACDSSPVAVETTRRALNTMLRRTDEMAHIQIKQPNCLFDAFVADPSLTADDDDNDEKSTYNICSFIQEVNRACAKIQSANSETFADDDAQQSNNDTLVGGGIVGIVLLVFVLSAVTPSRVDRFIKNVFLITKPGGKVCFRDYGIYDLSMLRFESSAVSKSAASTASDPVFIRGEGTIARFFSVESVKEIFASAGFTTIELRYCTVFNHNRKTGQKMKRVFVHGVFEKPKL